MKRVFSVSIDAMTIAAIIVLLSGCQSYKGAKVTEGTDLAIGITIPTESASLKLEALNYLSGFRMGVDQNAIMRLKYSCAETNDYFGCITTRTVKTVEADVEPCETSEANASKTE